MSTDNGGAAVAASIKRRHVIYAQGYDPRGLAEYYRLFRSEYRKFCALYGLSGRVGKIVNPPDRFTTHWTLDTEGTNADGEHWHVHTTYEFLRWEDIIRRDFARPAWWKTLYAIGTFVGTLVNGVYWRIARAHWRFALFMFYPFVILTTNLLAAALAGGLAGSLIGLFASPLLAWLIGIMIFVAAFVVIVRKTEPLSYMLYMFDDIASTHQFAYGRRSDWEKRFEAFADYLVEAVRTSDADEIVVVGHSSGSFVAVEVIGRALAHDIACAHGKPLSLVTIGANLPIIGFNPPATAFRDRLAALARCPDIDWIDYQSRKDVMNFYPFDPVGGHGLAHGAARQNPTIVPVRFRDIIRPESYAAFRWRFFRVHFQFLMANERIGAAYDYFMVCCGPFRLAARARHPEAVVARSPGSAAPELATAPVKG
ncbi:MAG TPA: hypothetical protein VNQ56_11040 [Pseudolabrys sp.]|nr:hypothetical protein [Pseudolabrys sp.]